MSSRSHSQSKERGKKREERRKKRGKRREEKRKRKRKKRNSCCSTTSPHLYSLSDNVVYSTPMSPDNKRAKELTQAAGVMPPAKVEFKGVAFQAQIAFSKPAKYKSTVQVQSVEEVGCLDEKVVSLFPSRNKCRVLILGCGTLLSDMSKPLLLNSF